MADEDERALARRASSGDAAAALALARALVRTGRGAEAGKWCGPALEGATPDVRLSIARSLALPVVLVRWQRGWALAAAGEQAHVLWQLPQQGPEPFFDGRTVVGLGPDGGVNVLSVADTVTPRARFEAPEGAETHAFFVHGETVFVGGRSKTRLSEIAFCGSLAATDEYPWESLEVPAEVKRYGKAVDAFLVLGDRLVAVDDIVLPKWLLVYRLGTPVPALIATPELESHFSYECVRGAAHDEKWVAILSSGNNRGNRVGFLAFLDAESLAERHVVGQPLQGYRSGDAEPEGWYSVAMSGGRALVASGSLGIAVCTPGEEKPRYVKPKLAKGERVVHVAPVGGGRAVISIESGEDASAVASRVAVVTVP